MELMEKYTVPPAAPTQQRQRTLPPLPPRPAILPTPAGSGGPTRNLGGLADPSPLDSGTRGTSPPRPLLQRDEKFVRGHNRVCKRLFFVDGAIDEDSGDTSEPAADEATEESPCYSLHAVAGVRFSDMLQAHVTIGSASFIALLDSGSSHNFISEPAARCSGLPLLPRPRLTATVANGDKVPCLGSAPSGRIQHPGLLHGRPLRHAASGFDIVLGAQWLGTLGPVT